MNCFAASLHGSSLARLNRWRHRRASPYDVDHRPKELTGKLLQYFDTQPNGSHPRRRSSRGRRGLTLALAFVLAIAGFFHGLGGAFDAEHGHDPISVSQGTQDLPCGSEQDSHPSTDGATCSTVTGCPLCAPDETPVAPAVWATALDDLRPATVPLGRTLSPQFRPPQVIPNV